MTNIHDDLLPGDEDAILGDLQQAELTAANAELTSDGKSLNVEKIQAAIKALTESSTGVGDVLSSLGNLGGSFATGGLLNRSASVMPILPTDDGDEAVMPRDNWRWYANMQPVMYRPKASAIITNVSV